MTLTNIYGHVNHCFWMNCGKKKFSFIFRHLGIWYLLVLSIDWLKCFPLIFWWQWKQDNGINIFSFMAAHWDMIMVEKQTILLVHGDCEYSQFTLITGTELAPLLHCEWVWVAFFLWGFWGNVWQSFFIPLLRFFLFFKSEDQLLWALLWVLLWAKLVPYISCNCGAYLIQFLCCCA